MDPLPAVRSGSSVVGGARCAAARRPAPARCARAGADVSPGPGRPVALPGYPSDRVQENGTGDGEPRMREWRSSLGHAAKAGVKKRRPRPTRSTPPKRDMRVPLSPILSTRMKAVSTPTQARFITPTAKSAHMRAQQQPARTEQERQHQHWHHEEVGDASTLCVAHLPPTDEQIERQVVHPPGEECPGILEQGAHARERRESTLAPWKCRYHERRVDERESEGHDDRPNCRGPAHPREKHQRQPPCDRDQIQNREELFGCHIAIR